MVPSGEREKERGKKGVGGGRGVNMGLYEILRVKLLKIVEICIEFKESQLKKTFKIITNGE